MGSLSKFETLKKDFLLSLPEDRYDLLKDLVDHSSCIGDFIFRHTDQLEYLFTELEKPLKGREKLVNEAMDLLDIPDDEEFIRSLTFFKMKHFSRIVAKDIKGKNELLDLTEEYSYLADACFEVSFERAYRKHKNRYGTPIDESTGEEAKGSVIALGKHGGLDLNYYSDVDVMYIYSNEGKTTKGITNREFFINMFKDVTRYLTKRNFEGITWIVDLDLRPEGKKGFIAYSLPAVEFYYWSHGRTWERHMLIKARHAAGDPDLSNEFMSIVQPFVYRKYSGEEIFEEILEMKKLIEAEAKKKIKGEYDVKRGEGGIREVEFTVQILQLLYGGKDPELRERRTMKALEKLVDRGYIPEEDGKILKDGYIFLRRLEHLIQIKNCVQTQSLDFKDIKYYASKLGFENEKDFLERLDQFRENIKRIFENITPETDIKLTPLQRFIITKQYEEEAEDYLESLGFKDPSWALSRFKEIFFSKMYVELTENSKEVLFSFLPEFEKELKEFPDREDFLLNFSKMMVEGGMLWVFVSALEQNENLVRFMLNIAKLSDYISDLMSKDRELLDWAFGIEDVPQEREGFEKELNVINKRLDLPDRLKKLKKIVEVLVSLKYLSQIGNKNAEKRLKEINISLSNLADYILEKLYDYFGGESFSIYALGKLGSREMNIGSDLDLIFVFKDERSKNRFIKIPSQIVKTLTSYSGEGLLYQLDLRLRPFGKRGELSPSLSFYKTYFEKEARSWERLAWTKARFITGDLETKERFEELIQNFLFSKPIDDKFIEDIFEMRFRLEGLVRETPEEIDIKLGKGGITDVEFLIQTFLIINRSRETNILNGVKRYLPNITDEYIFLREVEARLRMIKGVGMSKIYRNSPFLYRIAHSFNMEPHQLWERILNTKKIIRDIFLREIKLLRERFRT
ncbi:MAG TPA: glutamine-synthetase adenylyltransferase [Persephonella sp.]|uniref:Glutamate ammonia ligase adenylyl-transferase n=1 Tax=Persephonella marina (strain DSM 14350 / EX-H1) TaxID=123214 RepID=C0QTF4_PERMH|nr:MULTISPECIES: glutamine-synthetase adenylyltransferase [Persephonella]ACO03077.1 glutamate ammonia ligase adenylyl-transferase [Persephonella marina EX-H1]HCB70412.1 glutamine-synthetase adenylyltransferase [Persephonella sp.]